MYTAGQTLRSVTLVLMVAVFIYSTRPNDVVYLLSKAHLPAKLVFIVMVAYRFFPHIFHKLSIVISAQKLPRLEIDTGQPHPNGSPVPADHCTGADRDGAPWRTIPLGQSNRGHMGAGSLSLCTTS